ncbi:MAG: hypothetical protein JF604_05870 [Bradyrhizobium sp.]|nr:hypothetical protein [Bradyrhizobium sp.]
MAPIPPLKETKMTERLETLNKARARMLEDRDMHAKVLAASFDRDKAERARDKFIEIQLLIDALDRAIGGERAIAQQAELGRRRITPSAPIRLRTAPGSQAVLAKALRVNQVHYHCHSHGRLTPRHLASVGRGVTGWPGSCFDRFALT